MRLEGADDGRSKCHTTEVIVLRFVRKGMDLLSVENGHIQALF